MKVTPIIPTYKPVNPPPRAYMVIHRNKHEVVAANGERFSLPAKEAWAKYDELERSANARRNNRE